MEAGDSGACSRAKKYISNLKNVIESLKKPDIYNKINNIDSLIDAAERYSSDASYFIDKGDCETALVAVSYAEGLVDSLKYLGLLEPEWPSLAPAEEPRVFVAGTFDIIHPGHIELLRYASSLGRVYVVIARDENVFRSKGKRPLLSERSRLRVVSSIRYVYDARLGDPDDIFRPVRDIAPDIIVLGPDQPFDEEALAEKVSKLLGKRVRVVRFVEKREFEPGMRGSRDIIRKACCESYCQNMGCEQRHTQYR